MEGAGAACTIIIVLPDCQKATPSCIRPGRSLLQHVRCTVHQESPYETPEVLLLLSYRIPSDSPVGHNESLSKGYQETLQ